MSDLGNLPTERRRPGVGAAPSAKARPSWRAARFVSVAAIVVVITALLYFGICWIFSQKLIAQQFTADEDVAFSDFGLPQPESLTIANGSTKLAGWYFANPRRAGCAAILLHGYTGNKAGVLTAAPLVWNRGCDVLVYDLRGHGDSSRGFHTYGVLDKDDELAAIDWLRRKTGLPDGRIGLIGWSYGAATSLQAAAVRPDLAFVIADASYSSLADIAKVQADKMIGSWTRIFVPGALLVSGWRAGFSPADASPERAVKGLKTPVLLVHSTTDEFTPYQQSEAIYANSDHQHTELVLTRYGAEHARSYETDPVAYTQYVDQFLAKFVPNFGVRTK